MKRPLIGTFWIQAVACAACLGASGFAGPGFFHGMVHGQEPERKEEQRREVERKEVEEKKRAEAMEARQKQAQLKEEALREAAMAKAEQDKAMVAREMAMQAEAKAREMAALAEQSARESAAAAMQEKVIAAKVDKERSAQVIELKEALARFRKEAEGMRGEMEKLRAQNERMRNALQSRGQESGPQAGKTERPGKGSGIVVEGRLLNPEQLAMSRLQLHSALAAPGSGNPGLRGIQGFPPGSPAAARMLAQGTAPVGRPAPNRPTVDAVPVRVSVLVVHEPAREASADQRWQDYARSASGPDLANLFRRLNQDDGRHAFLFDGVTVIGEKAEFETVSQESERSSRTTGSGKVGFETAQRPGGILVRSQVLAMTGQSRMSHQGASVCRPGENSISQITTAQGTWVIVVAVSRARAGLESPGRGPQADRRDNRLPGQPPVDPRRLEERRRRSADAPDASDESRRRPETGRGPEVRGEPNRGGPERGGPERGGPERGGPERGGPERGGPERGGPERGGPERGGPERGGPERAADRGDQERGSVDRGPVERDGRARDRDGRGPEGRGPRDEERPSAERRPEDRRGEEDGASRERRGPEQTPGKRPDRDPAGPGRWEGVDLAP